MIEVLKLLVGFIVQPLNILFSLILVALWFYYRKQYHRLKTTGIFILIFFLSTSTNPLPNLLVEKLESKYDPISVDSELTNYTNTHILVLGSGHTAHPDLPPTGQLSTTAMHRLNEGIRLHRLLPGSMLIVSGYGRMSKISQAEVLAEAAMALGVDEGDLRLSTTPSTTAEEASSYKERFGDQNRLILVTSAVHMPRVLSIFRNRGLDPLAAPADFRVKEDPAEAFSWDLFSHDNFYKVETALHEYIGMLWEKMSN